MLTIFIIYSPDRKRQLEIMVSCLEEMDGYNYCQKILCVDGEPNIVLPDFKIVSVKRINKYFNWSAAWNTGVSCAKFDKLLYLDSDRILPKNYLVEVHKLLKDDEFVYSKKLVHLKDSYSLNVVKEIRSDPYFHSSKWDLDLRLSHPPSSPVLKIGKNPMSGNTAFTKATWTKTGGIDNTFEGWGFPDTEYYIRTWRMGMKFKTIECIELHLHHEYAVKVEKFKLMHIWNACKLANKFNLKLNDDYNHRIEKLGITVNYLSRFSNMEGFIKYMENKNSIKLI